jgi:phage host-nuclease inhibitor protein Gam
VNDLVNTQAQDLAAHLAVSELSINDLDSQIKTLQAKKKSMTAEIDDFKNDLRQSMTEHGVTRIESKEFGILFRLDKPSVVVKITDEILIDDKYFKTVKQLDKLAVKKALQVGDSVQGAELSEGKHKLTVKV